MKNETITKKIQKERKKKLNNKIGDFDKTKEEGTKKGNWSKKEDEYLINWVKENGPNLWTECSKLIKGRCGKQCRERWVNTLDPNVKKGNWDLDDQIRIFELLKENFTSWSSISRNMIGRTENSIKNFFYSTIRRLKTNAIINFLKDFQNQKLTDDKIENLINKTQIKSINHLSYLIITFILKNEEWDQREITLRKYLFQILLEDLNKTIKKINFNTVNNQKPLFKFKENSKKNNEENDENNNMIEENDNIEEENENQNEIINHSINLKDIKNNSSLEENLNIFFDLLNNLKYTNPSQKIKINIPSCWNCQNNEEHCHVEKINNLFSKNLNNNNIEFNNTNMDCSNGNENQNDN